MPTTAPSMSPTAAPTMSPSPPTLSPTDHPTYNPSINPSRNPTIYPSSQPSNFASLTPTRMPSFNPTQIPLKHPSLIPTTNPSFIPTNNPTDIPSNNPSRQPSILPTTNPSFSPSTIPSANPTFIPTINPSMIPSTDPSRNPSTVPTAVPYANPSFIPSNNPSVNPSTHPSNNPSIVPSLDPSFHPSMIPTTQPSLDPSAQPSDHPSTVPTKIPTDVPSPRMPTTYPSPGPTYATNEAGFEMISQQDINFYAIESSGSYVTSDPDDNDLYFNPGFKNKLTSRVEVSLDNEYKWALFDAWFNSGNESSEVNITLTVEWLVYDVTDDVGNATMIEFSNDIDTLSYVDVKLDSNSSVFKIQSYYVIDSDSVTADAAKFSGLPSLCTTFDDTYFKQGRRYKFENIVEFTWIDDDNNITYIETDAESIEFVANSMPFGGDCVITSPASGTGTVLIDQFNVSCFGWHDNEASILHGDVLEYNFILDDSNTFLNSEYSSTHTWGQTRLTYMGEHFITAVIVDKFNLAACVQLQAYANYDSINDQIDGNAPENFTNWLTDTYQSILSDNTSSTTEAFVTLQGVIGMQNDFVAINEIDAIDIANSTLILLQQDILNSSIAFIDGSGGEGPLVALAGLSTLSKVTEPMVRVEDLVGIYPNFTNGNFSDDSEDENENIYVYDCAVVTNVFNVMSSGIIGGMNNGDGSVAVTSDTADTVFGVFSNLQEMRRISNESDDMAKDNGQIIINSTASIGHLLLNNSVPGESHVITTKTMGIKMAKISKDSSDACGTPPSAPAGSGDATEVEPSIGFDLSPELLDIESDGGNSHMDCNVMVSKDNVYGSFENVSNTSWKSDFVLIGVSGGESDPTNGRRRRRMQSDNSDGWLSACQPIIIRYNASGSGSGTDFPKCSFYNETTRSNSGDGCYVLSSDSVTGIVTCSCLHLTYFTVEGENFAPEINFITEDFYSSISWENLWKHPLGWIFVSTLFFVTFLLYLLLNQVDCIAKNVDIPLLV